MNRHPHAVECVEKEMGMTGGDLGSAIGSAMVAMIIVAVVCASAITAALIFGLPWLWTLLKPWLHAITA